MLHRRDFLRTTALAMGGVLLDGPLRALVRGLAGLRTDDDRTLVLVELTGGNDGLNTVVPFADDRYHRARPSLRIAADAVHKLDDVVGLAPQLGRLSRLFRDGGLTVVQGVGMPDADRSHFLSLDRWHTASVARTPKEEGWLGRALHDLTAAAAPLPGLCLGDRALPRVLQGSDRPTAACESLHDLLPAASLRDRMRSQALEKLDASWGSAVDRATAASARRLLDRLDDVARMDLRGDEFPGSPLGEKLADALRLIIGGLSVPAIFVRTGGFDTHAQQAEVHGTLLADVDASLGAFARAIAARKLGSRVLVIVYSEFGRRTAENGSRGTDHGSAAPAFVFGGDVPAGVIGDHPDLANLDDGDVRMTLDFRRLVAQALKHLRHPSPTRIVPAEITPLA